MDDSGNYFDEADNGTDQELPLGDVIERAREIAEKYESKGEGRRRVMRQNSATKGDFVASSQHFTQISFLEK